MESSFSELEEHQRWKVVTWSLGYSPFFPSKLGISKVILTGTGGQFGSWHTRSFVVFNKSCKFKFAKKGRRGLDEYWI